MTENTVIRQDDSCRWKLQTTEKYVTQLKWYTKKHPNELTAVIGRLDTYFKTLNECNEPQQVTGGWIHPEPHGVKAITEKGKGGSLMVTRLYLFPDKEDRRVILLTIGNKNSQKDDIQYCSEYVKKLNKEKV